MSRNLGVKNRGKLQMAEREKTPFFILHMTKSMTIMYVFYFIYPSLLNEKHQKMFCK